MGNKNYFLLIAYLFLINKILGAPLASSQVDENFCTGNDLLRYEYGKEYSYDYNTKTSLWINDVSEESKSTVELKAKVYIRSVEPCLYILRLEDASLSGESLNGNDLASVLENLNDYAVQFRLNSKGELDSSVDFTEGDKPWSRNIKRGILSALQLKSVQSLENLDSTLEDTGDKKSLVVYETDVLGRCRTTYSSSDSSASSEIKLTKRKSLHRCTLSGNGRTSAIQYSTYKHMPEFYQGRLFIERYECDSTVKNGLLDNVECEEKSTYKLGSRGDKGAQAVVKQTLKYLSTFPGFDRRAFGPFETHKIEFEFTDKSVEDSEYRNFNIDNYLNDLCSRVKSFTGLDNDHANNFRNLVNKVETLSKDEMYQTYQSSKSKCDLAGSTFSHALVFANNENSFETVLRLLDENAFNDQKYITEYPVLTALARNQEPGLEFLKRLKSYLESKRSDFQYLRKLYLVYSSLVKSYCKNNECNDALLEVLSSVVAKNLGTNCADSSNKDLVTTSLKAIGNIGYIKNVDVLAECASREENTLETRVSAIQAFRRFECSRIGSAKGLLELIKKSDADTELRINVFNVIIKCSESEKFLLFAKDNIVQFLEQEQDIQFVTYVIDYAKEHGLTVLLNPILTNPKLKEKFSVNFKELSWNNFRYRYSLLRDAAVELDTSVVYVSQKTFIPRSIRFNATLHAFGTSVNFADVQLRLEGLEDALKGILVDKLTSEQLVKKLLEKPEQLLEILQIVADKLKYANEKPFLSLLVRVYGSDVFYSELNTIEKLQKLTQFLRSPKEALLYAQVNTIKNMFLLDSRIRQPLLNGFEFNKFTDVELSLLLNKQSSKTDTSAKREFKINNFYSLSASLNKRYEVQINKDNRLSLKKKSFLNTRLRLDVNGEKTNNSRVYNLNLTPNTQVPLLVFDGKFYKLSANSQYKEVTKFNVEQYTYQNCTSNNFHIGFGVDLCLSIQRPKIGSIIESLRPVDLDKFLVDDNDEEDDDDDNDEDDEQEIYSSVKRPKLTLSGPYHYEVTLKNPELIKTIVLSAEYIRNDQGAFLNGALKTVSSSNKVQNRLELVYSRKRDETNRAFSRLIDLELRVANTKDVRLKLSGDLYYKKQEVLRAKLQVQNKILREFSANLNFLREKSSENIVPEYNLEFEYNSKIRSHKQTRLLFNIKPDQRNIKSNLVLERLCESTNFNLVRLFNAKLTLDAKSQSGVNHDLDFTIDNKILNSKTHLYGHVEASLFTSNIDLSLEYENPRFKFDEPVVVRFSHKVDAASGGKSYAELGFKLYKNVVDYKAKLIVVADISEMKLHNIELQINTPKTLTENNGLPYIIYFAKENKNDESIQSSKYTFGIKDFLIDLSERQTGLSKALKRLDENDMVKSFSIEYTRVRDMKKHSFDVLIKASKNNVDFAKFHTNLNGNLRALRENLNEIPNQSFGTEFHVKVFDISGGLTADVNLESSLAKKQHSFDFNLETENIMKILLKVISINTKVRILGDKVTAEHEMHKLGEVKNLKISATNTQKQQLSADEKGFNVDYVKNMASGEQFKSSGVVKYKFKSFKNFESSLDIKNNFKFNVYVQNERSNDQLFGLHDIRMNYAHLDAQQAEREIKFFVNNKTETKSNTFVFNFSAKKGKPNQLEQVEQLDYIFDINTQNKYSILPSQKRILSNGVNNVLIKAKQLNININLNSNANLDVKTKKYKVNVDLNAKFPAIKSDPGKLNELKNKFLYTRSVVDQKRTISFSLETDNKVIGRLTRNLNIEYVRQPPVNNNNSTNIDLNVNFLSANNEKKYLDLNIERQNCNNPSSSNSEDDEDNELKHYVKLCSGTKVNLKQNIKSKVYSVIVQDTSFDASECKAETKLVRNKQDKPSYDYVLDVLGSLECGSTVLINNALYVHRYADKSRDGLKTTDFKLNVHSDLYFGKNTIEVKHKKFSKNDGLFDGKLQVGSFVQYSNKISYTRVLDQNTNKLSSGKYTMSTSFGKSTTKTCELNIESKQNYYNKLSCKLKTEKLPVELSYGYSLKVNNVKELAFGKRNFELDINLPSSRQLRLEYDSNRVFSGQQQQQFDDDNDSNNEREFNTNAKVYWDFNKNKDKFLTLNVRRDNYENTNSKLTVDLSSPSLKSFKVVVDRKRLFNETVIKTTASYELDNNRQNQLTILARLNSDLDANKVSIEFDLQRPSINVLYESRFNKYNGRLQYLGLRLGKLIQFSVDKEYDADNRLIRLVLSNPDESKFKVDTTVKQQTSSVYLVESELKQSNQLLTKLESKFDSNNNIFEVNVNALKAKQVYKLKVNLYNESLANAVLRHVSNNNQILGVASLGVVNHDGTHNDVELSLKWNRLWNQLQKAILNGQLQELEPVESSSYNSFIGDAYSSLVNDAKPVYDSVKTETKNVKNDLGQLLFLIVDYYSNFLPKNLKSDLIDDLKFIRTPRQLEQLKTVPLPKSLIESYNNLATKLNRLHLNVRKYSKRLSKLIPRLTVIKYNSDDLSSSNKMASLFDNNLVASRPAFNAYNLYQLNAEFRDYLRKTSQMFLRAKSNILRLNKNILNIRSLINKYKVRSINDYTIVGHVFNRRNIISFNGESRVLRSRCKFLLAHELKKNQFTVVLNNNNDNGILSISAYGQPAIDINGNSAYVNNKQISLPYRVDLVEKSGQILVKRSHNSVSVQVNNDLLVTCYEDSKSCSIALTRWYTGRLNGLLGKSNHDLENLNEDYWFLDRSCKTVNLQLKKPTDESVKSCHLIFGRHSRSLFKNAVQAINPSGWQRLCESALTADVNNKCLVMRAFVHHARLRQIQVDEPNECFQCQAKDKSFLIGQTVSSADLVESGSDYVFVFLPCNKNKYALDLSSSVKKISSKYPSNRYYFVKVHENNGASIYQSEQSQINNFDIRKAYQTIAEDKTSNIKKDDLYNALFLAGSLFANRLAENRQLIIVGCGNCIKYSSKAAILLEKLLEKRNIVVSSWDEYDITDNDGGLNDEVVVGYSQEKVFLNKKGTNEVQDDSLDGYKLEHRGDLCQRLAAKTDGNLFNINYMKNPQIFEQIAEKLQEEKPKYKYSLKKCERVDTPYGDVDDFSYDRIEIDNE